MTNNDEHALGGGSKQKRIFGDNYFNPSYAAVLSMVSVDEMLKLSFLAAYLELFRVEFNIFWLKMYTQISFRNLSCVTTYCHHRNNFA
jgi:hypothetical protein